jgi:hypothetical protein
MDKFEKLKINKTLTSLFKKREAFFKGKEYLIFFVFFGLLFLFDYSGSMELYDQNFVRRIMNMYRRTDSLSYSNKLRPFCEPVKKMLDSEDIKKLQSIRIPQSRDLSLLTRQNTTTHQCCENYSETEKNIIKEISEKVIKKYEVEIGKKLYYMSKEKATIYVYHGKNAKHLWHVDPQNLSEIHNVIICFKKRGNISPLQCKDKNGDVKSIHFEEGDAAIFNGGTTVHQVPPNEDDNSERTVLSLAFTTNPEIGTNRDNMCTYTKGGNDFFNIFKLVFAIFIINFVVSQLSGVNHLSYTFLFPFVIIVMIVVKYIPFYFDIGLGSGRSSSIYHNTILLIATIVSTVSIKGAILFYSYFLLSDVFFPRSWVAYD